jgi:hypothetical protein
MRARRGACPARRRGFRRWLLEPEAPVYGELGLLFEFPFELGKLD